MFRVKKKIRRVLILLFALIFVGSAVQLLRLRGEYRAGEELYAEAEQIAFGGAPEPEPAPEVPAEPVETPDAPTEEPAAAEEPPAEEKTDLIMNLPALQAVNSDVIGWIWIPNTGLSYPLVQGEDNDYYLNHGWNGKKVSAGSIFMDFNCAADLSDYNTIIYGHRMKNESMFAFLKYYKKPDYQRAHPYIYVKTGEATRCYEVFAAYEAPVGSVTYALTVTDEADKQSLIDFALSRSVIDMGVVPTTGARILTLSTCTGNGYDTRWVVQAVERPE